MAEVFVKMKILFLPSKQQMMLLELLNFDIAAHFTLRIVPALFKIG